MFYCILYYTGLLSTRAFLKGVPSAESSRSVRGLGKGVSGKPYPRLCNARRLRLEPGAVRLYRLHQARPSTRAFLIELKFNVGKWWLPGWSLWNFHRLLSFEFNANLVSADLIPGHDLQSMYWRLIQNSLNTVDAWGLHSLCWALKGTIEFFCLAVQMNLPSEYIKVIG